MVMLLMHRYILNVALFIIIGINHAARYKTNAITTPYKIHTEVPATCDAESISYGNTSNGIGVSVH